MTISGVWTSRRRSCRWRKKSECVKPCAAIPTATAPEQSTKLVLDTVRAAKGKEKVTAELQLHSDQGFQYTSQAYFKLTQRYGITPSRSRRGNPYDNALAENFFSILKTECIYRTKIATLAEAKKLMDDYIFFYNNQRIQLKTKLTPLELRRQYLA